jgi:salicylate hydroxylase
VGADGVKSLLPGIVTGIKNIPHATGDAAYRCILPTDLMLADNPFFDTQT